MIFLIMDDIFGLVMIFLVVGKLLFVFYCICVFVCVCVDRFDVVVENLVLLVFVFFLMVNWVLVILNFLDVKWR